MFHFVWEKKNFIIIKFYVLSILDGKTNDGIS